MGRKNTDAMEQVNVIFKECEAGWILFAVSVGLQSVKCRATHVWDPFPQMVVWLESIAADAQTCSFRMEEEGPEKEFMAFRCADGSIRLMIQDAIAHRVLLEAQVNARQCVSAFYKNLRSFAESPAYVPRQWEDQTESMIGPPAGEGTLSPKFSRTRVGSYGGCHLRDLASDKLESWLD